MQRWTSQTLALPPRTSWQRADLEFEGVEHDGASFVMHVFLNNPDADEATPRTPEQRYAGYLTVFAHGDCWGDVVTAISPSRSARSTGARPTRCSRSTPRSRSPRHSVPCPTAPASSP